jgi:hypothetical protein
MSDDAQRTMEQRSLRNVRGLIDKLERDAERQKRTTRMIGWGLVIALVVVLGTLFTLYKMQPQRQVQEIVLTPQGR